MQLPKILVQPQSLASILMSMKSGELQVPRFQRDFVWTITKTRALFDSIYKEFPIGTFFLWHAPEGIPPLSRPLDELGIPGPQPGAQVSYILDGQQRLTSLYCAVNGTKIGSRDYGRICIDLATATKFDHNKEEDFNEDIFVYRTNDNKQSITVKDLVSPNALMLYDGVPIEWKPAFNKIYTLFQTYPFSVVWIQEQPLSEAIVIFQRINQAGQRLSRYDLVCANVWREDFDFRKMVSEINQQLNRQGFGEIDETVFTQSFALILGGQCTTLAELSLETEQVKNAWDSVIKSIELAVDFSAHSLGVQKAEFLPYRGQLVVLAYYFFIRGNGAISVKEREMLWTWFWRVTLSERYSSTSPMRMAEDAKKMKGFHEGKEAVFNYPSAATMEEILRTKMSSTTSALRNGILCMLALNQPRNFKDNSLIALNDNFFSNLKQAERHHIFPVGYLKTHGINPNQVHLVPNFCFIPSDLNKEIGSQCPADYMKKYKKVNPSFEKALITHMIPVSENSPLWNSDPSAFSTFLQSRATLLSEEINKLANIGPTDLHTTLQEQLPNEVDLLEILIREFINERLVAVSGESYWKNVVPGDVQEQVNVRVKDHLSRHPYYDPANFLNGRVRLDFCDVADYEKIMLKNWDVFEDTFQRKPELQTHMAAFRNYRNCTQHNRKPTDVEQKNGEAAMIWIKSILNKYTESKALIDSDNGDSNV